MNAAYLYKSQGIFIKEVDEYWLCVPIGSDTEPSTIYKYNWRTGQIYKDYRSGLTAFGLFLNTTDLSWDDMTGSWDSSALIWNSNINQSLNPVVIFGDSSGISTERTPTSNDDNGTAVESIWDTKDFTAADLGVPDISTMFRWKGLSVWAKGQSMTVYYSINGGSSWVLATTLTLASDYPSDDSPLNVYFDVVSSQIRFRFYNNQDEEIFHLKKYQVKFSQRELRK